MIEIIIGELKRNLDDVEAGRSKNDTCQNVAKHYRKTAHVAQKSEDEGHQQHVDYILQ